MKNMYKITEVAMLLRVNQAKSVYFIIFLFMIACKVLCSGMESTDLLEKPGLPFPRIANCYGVWLVPESSDRDIDEISKFDLLIGGVWCNWSNDEHVRKLNERIKEIRRINPNMIILDFSVSAPYSDPKDTKFPESGWLKQPDGKYIDGWPGTRMINLLKTEAINWVVDHCIRSVREMGFDGVFIDCMAGTFDWWACNIASMEPYQVDANEDGQPDSQNWLNEKWIEAKTKIVQSVRAEIGAEKLFMTNQGGEWSFSGTNGVLFEDNLDYVLAGAQEWEDVLKAYLHWTETPHRPNVTTIVSSSGIEPPFDPWNSMSPKEREAMLERGRSLQQRMRFGLTTTLMGDGYFAYDLHTRWRGQRWWYPEYDAPLGYPKGKTDAQDDGTWRREFDGGTVIVNPTILDAKIRFGKQCLDISSGKVDIEFIIPSHDGRLFIKTNEKPKPGSIPDPDPLFTMSAPERIAQRNGVTLCRFENAAALFNNQGQLEKLFDGKRTFVSGVKAMLIGDERWNDFGYEDCASRMTDGSKLQFSGKRVKGDVSLAYDQIVEIKDNCLSINYKWKALTDVNLYAWRQQIDFPVSQYASGQFSINGVEFKFPINPEKGSISSQGSREIIVIHPDGARVTVKTSIDSYIQDERLYNGKEYRLFFGPMGYEPKSFKAGDSWEYTITLSWSSP